MQHRDAQKGEIHIIHNFEFANITERDAYTPTSNDLNKICLVLEPYGFYALKSIEPTSWNALSTVTINLNDLSVYTDDQVNALLTQKSDIFNVSATEYKCGYKRNGLDVYGIEINFGALPNNNAKAVAIPNYNINYKYWFNSEKSYAEGNGIKYTLPFVSDTSHYISAWINQNLVTLASPANYTNLTAKIVLNYTKG